MVPTAIAAARSSITVASCASTAPSTRSCATAMPCAASRWRDGTEITAPVVVSACDPHSTFLEWLRESAAWRRATSSSGGGPLPQPDGYESKVDAVVSPAPRLRAVDAPLGTTTIVAPSLAEIDRAHRADARGRGAPDARRCSLNVPSLARSDDDGRRRVSSHVLSLEVLYTPYRLRGGWPGSTEPRRWLELFGDLCEPGFLESIDRVAGDDARRLRARLPPAGRSRDELRRRSAGGAPQPEPGADPLRDSGAGSLPHRRGDVPRRRRLGRERPELRGRRARTPGAAGRIRRRPCSQRRSNSAGSPASRSTCTGASLSSRSCSAAGSPRRSGWPAAAAGVVLFLGSILGHELSHALVARRFGVGTRSIELWALGGMARLDRESPIAEGRGLDRRRRSAGEHRHRRRVARRLVRVSTPRGLLPTVAAVLGWLGFINLALALFNLLPGAPLDGGRIVQAVRWRIHGDRYRATREAARAGHVPRLGDRRSRAVADAVAAAPGSSCSSPVCSSPSTPSPR